MKKLNKILYVTLMLVLVVALVPCSTAQAKKKSSKELLYKIQQGLDAISYQRDEIGLSDVDFSSIKIGHIIHAYEYKNNELSELDFTLYPLFEKKRLVAFAIDEPGKNVVDITTQLVNEVADYSGNKKPFALIYDNEGCYLYSKKDMKLLGKYSDNAVVKSRSNLTESKSLDLQQCQKDFDTNDDLNHLTMKMTD